MWYVDEEGFIECIRNGLLLDGGVMNPELRDEHWDLGYSRWDRNIEEEFARDRLRNFEKCRVEAEQFSPGIPVAKIHYVMASYYGAKYFIQEMEL